MITKAPTEPVVADDIHDAAIADKVHEVRAAQAAASSTGARAALAQAAQDHLIALRLVGVGYNAHAVCLEERGDLYVFGAPCHPRAAAEKLSDGSNITDLLELVRALQATLERIAGVPVVAALADEPEPAPS